MTLNAIQPIGAATIAVGTTSRSVGTGASHSPADFSALLARFAGQTVEAIQQG
jgi:hypothetical protein